MATLLLNAVQNTFISKLLPDKIYNCPRFLFAGKNNYKSSICRSLFKFDIDSIKPSVNIKNAALKLYLYRNDVPSSIKPLSVHNLLAPFDEKSVSYLTQPEFDPIPSATLEIKSEKEVFLQWDITNLFCSWLKGKTSNYGFVLTGHEAQYSLTGFFSNKCGNPNLRPVILINYSTNEAFIEYPPEKVTTSECWRYTTPVPLNNRIATFGVQNIGSSGNAYVKLQLSPDGLTWLDDCPTYMSLAEFSPGNNAILTTTGYMAFARAAYKSSSHCNPAKLTIYVTTKC